MEKTPRQLAGFGVLYATSCIELDVSSNPKKNDGTSLAQWTTYQKDKQNDLTTWDFNRHFKKTDLCSISFPIARKNLKFNARPHWYIRLCPQRHQPMLGKAKSTNFANDLFQLPLNDELS